MLEIINIVFVAETASALGLLYFLSIDKNMILSFIGDVILFEVRKNDIIELRNDSLSKKKKLVNIPKWKKPLGACHTCTMVWVGVFTGLLFWKFTLLFKVVSVVSNGVLIFRKIA